MRWGVVGIVTFLIAFFVACEFKVEIESSPAEEISTAYVEPEEIKQKIENTYVQNECARAWAEFDSVEVGTLSREGRNRYDMIHNELLELCGSVGRK